MARVTKRLTNIEVKQAKSYDKEFNLIGGDELAFRVKPNGSKLWVFNTFWPYTKTRTSISFGARIHCNQYRKKILKNSHHWRRQDSR